MIKGIATAARRSDFEEAAFHDYWKNVHGYQLPEQVGPVFVRCSLTLEDNLADTGIRTGELGCQ